MGLQFFPDKPAALAEMHRVLAPGGRMALNLPGPTPEPLRALADRLADHVGPPAAGFIHQVFSLHQRDEVEEMIVEAGFDDVEVDHTITTLHLPPAVEFLWQYVSSTPLSELVSQLSSGERAALEREVAAEWSPIERDGASHVEVGITVATARR